MVYPAKLSCVLSGCPVRLLPPVAFLSRLRLSAPTGKVATLAPVSKARFALHCVPALPPGPLLVRL